MCSGITSSSQAVTSRDVLIKGSGDSVYYYASDDKRYVFPTEKTYSSWFTNFDGIITVTDSELGAIPIGGNVRYRPGVRMVKITTDPKVYAVDAGGTLRWVNSEAAAIALYGSSWNQNIDDIPDAFFVNYSVGAPISSLSDFNPDDVLTDTQTINANKGLSVSEDARIADTVVGSSGVTPSDSLSSSDITNQGRQTYSTGGWVEVTSDGIYRYVESNGIPNHATGDFPNSGNPNTISEQSQSFRMALNPVYTAQSTDAQLPGIAVNGVLFEPGTAERNGSWSYEAFQDELNLGLDTNNAHVQPTGTYHYHGIPTGLIALLDDGASDLIQVGWAADGHGMYYSKSGAYDSSYRLKTGTRSDIGGTYDGTYTQDFEYVQGLGDLDVCNGTTVNGDYIYILTDEFPYISRCMHGTVDASFNKGPGSGGTGAPSGPGGSPPPHPHY